MSTSSHVRSKVTAVFAFVFLIPALILFLMWFSIGLQNSGLNGAEKISRYLGYFPGFMRSFSTIHIISIVCCVVAMAFAARSFRKQLLSERLLMFLVVIVALIILLFDIYQIV